MLIICIAVHFIKCSSLGLGSGNRVGLGSSGGFGGSG